MYAYVYNHFQGIALVHSTVKIFLCACIFRVAKGNGIESIAKGWRRPGPYSMAGKEPDIPAGRAVETADNTAQQWDSITPYYKEK